MGDLFWSYRNHLACNLGLFWCVFSFVSFVVFIIMWEKLAIILIFDRTFDWSCDRISLEWVSMIIWWVEKRFFFCFSSDFSEQGIYCKNKNKRYFAFLLPPFRQNHLAHLKYSLHTFLYKCLRNIFYRTFKARLETKKLESSFYSFITRTTSLMKKLQY